MNIHEIVPGQHLWFSDKQNVGQIRVIDVDDDGTVHYTSYDGIHYNKDLTLKKSQLKNFYSNPADAISKSQEWISQNMQVDPLDPTKLIEKPQLYICD